MQSSLSNNPRTRAQQLLERMNVRALPVAVDKIAKSLGAQLCFSPLDEELSGMIFIKENVPIIGVNSLHHPNRQRFTIAHEIGHLELHRELIANKIHVDKKFSVLMRDANSATGTARIEIEANKFAAELLMPESILHRALEMEPFDIDDDAPIAKLAKRFRVSRQALEYQIVNLS
jgi:Zn-dependent peptidase ImmA (M78 family)